MRSKLLAPSLAILMLGVAACGSSSSSPNTSTPSSSTVKRAGPGQIYRVALTGTAETPRGAPNGTGAAVIALHGSSRVCWRFAHLHGFTNATFAHIHLGTTRKSGKVVVPLSTGPRLHHQGCVRVTATLVKAIEHNPRDYYVNIHSTTYPGGAVRAQL
jgi:hypothetical protein